MKKKRNRGVTLSELIVSIALISIVITFLFNLLVDVRASDNNSDFDRKNQQQRAIILKMIQDDFVERGLRGIVEDNDKSNENQLVLNFNYNDGTTGNITVTKDTITYEIEGNTEKWNLKKQNNNTYFNINCVSYNTSINSENQAGEFFSVQFRIPVVVQKNSSNVLDDLEFYYVGLKEGQENFPKKTSLGNYDNNRC